MTRSSFASLAILTATLACRNAPTAPDGGLRLSLSLTRTELQRGVPDTMTMTLANTNPYPVSLTGDVCEPQPYVLDASGTTVVPAGGGWFCIAVLGRWDLKAGESQSRTFIWETSAFTPGIYAVYATFTADGVQLATPRTAVRLI